MRREKRKFSSKALFTAGALTLGLLGSTAGGLAREADDKPSASLTAGAYSQYIWRGYELSRDSVVIQPSATVSYKGFGVNLWGNLDTDQWNREEDSFNWGETDITTSYSGSYQKLGYVFGHIYYDLEMGEDTQEVFAGLSLSTLMAPSLKLYKDIANFPSWFATIDISHPLPVTDKLALNLGAQVSYMDDGNGYSEFHHGILSVSIPFPVNDFITVSPEIHWSFPISSKAGDFTRAHSIDGDTSNFVYGGITVSLLL